MAKQRRKFKQRIISEVESGLIPVNAANRKYQISGSVIDRWRDQARQGGLDGAPSVGERFGTRESRAEGKFAELYLENRHLEKVRTLSGQRKNISTCVITAQNLARPLKEANHEAGIEQFLLSTDVEERDFKDAELRDHIEAAPAEVSRLWIIGVGPAAAP